MSACLGVLGESSVDQLSGQILQIVGGHQIPIVNGILHVYSKERYELTFVTVLDMMRANSGYRYIWTLGDYNSQTPTPGYYNTYCKFALSEDRTPGEVLLCPQIYATAVNAFHLDTTGEYLPLTAGHIASAELVETIFGRVQTSRLWYSSHSVDYIDPHAPFDAMTRRSELPFWYSSAGFLYLAHQAWCIRVYRPHSRRIVAYSEADLNNRRFLKLMFTFDALGIELLFVYERDFAAFMHDQQMEQLEIFSRAGNNSFLLIGSEAHHSGERGIAEAIMLAQEEMIGTLGVKHGIDDLMRSFEPIMRNANPVAWKALGAASGKLFEEFSQKPVNIQRGLIETYLQRWQQL